MISQVRLEPGPAKGIRMRLDRNEIIGGQPIRRVRDFIRMNRDARPAPSEVISFFKTNRVTARAIIDAMMNQGLITRAAPEAWDRRKEVYTVTDLGVRFAAARLLKPISRAKADGIVSDLLARVEAINTRDDVTHFVGEVRAFGSYITDAPDVGDIDLAISFLAKPPPIGHDFIEWHLERAQQSGCVLSSYIEMLFYSENEVRRLVKGRNQYVSIHPMGDLDRMKIESRCSIRHRIAPCISKRPLQRSKKPCREGAQAHHESNRLNTAHSPGCAGTESRRAHWPDP
jgi:predicted transcriptional regulator